MAASGEWRETWRDNFSDGYQPGDILSSLFNHNKKKSAEDEANQLQTELEAINQPVEEIRQEYLEDREHTEVREDSAYQRAVEDMKNAGLNPYTIGSSPTQPSPSSVGENSMTSKLQMLGYIMDLKNLDSKNKSVANGLLGNILSFIGRILG